MYLLLRRDVERFNIAKTKILHKEELLDAADSLLWVLKAVNYRYLDLSGTRSNDASHISDALTSLHSAV